VQQLIVVVMLMLSTSAWAEWTHVNDDDTFVLYADMATIRTAGNTVKMWTLVDFKTAKGSTGQAYLSHKSQWEYDCAGERLRLLYISWHSGQMGQGDTVDSDGDAGTWTPVPPDSNGEILWRIACKQ